MSKELLKKVLRYIEKAAFYISIVFLVLETLVAIYYAFALTRMRGESMTETQTVAPGGQLRITRKITGEPDDCIVESVRTIIPTDNPTVKIRPEPSYSRRTTTGEPVRIATYHIIVPIWLPPGDYYFQGAAVYTCHIFHSLFGPWEHKVQPIYFKVALP